MIDWIISNYEWVFGGIGAVIVGSFLSLFLNNKKDENETSKNVVNNTINNQISLGHIDESRGGKKENEENKKERYKELSRILFVDDDPDFKHVSIVKKAGWRNTKHKKDVCNLDDKDVVDSDIIFVDINGVGVTLFPKEQGLGLAPALKKKYPEKRIIIYSAEREGDRFHSAFKKVDDYLSKNAEPYEFINIIDNYSKELYCK